MTSYICSNCRAPCGQYSLMCYCPNASIWFDYMYGFMIQLNCAYPIVEPEDESIAAINDLNRL